MIFIKPKKIKSTIEKKHDKSSYHKRTYVSSYLTSIIHVHQSYTRKHLIISNNKTHHFHTLPASGNYITPIPNIISHDRQNPQIKQLRIPA